MLPESTEPSSESRFVAIWRVGLSGSPQIIYRDVLSLSDELSSVSLMGLLSANFSFVGDVDGGVVNVFSDVVDDTDVRLLLLIDKADVNSRREIES